MKSLPQSAEPTAPSQEGAKAEEAKENRLSADGINFQNLVEKCGFLWYNII